MFKKTLEIGQTIWRKGKMYVMTATGLVLATSAHAQTNATDIVTSASTAFTAVAGLCVTIGTFFVVYRLVKRAK